MLTEKEIKKIDDLIDQDKSNYRIGKETHHSPNTINKRRLEREKIGQEQTSREEVLVKNPIDILRRTIKEIDAIIQTKQLEDREKKKWEKWAEPLREIIKTEVDDRIAKERADVIEGRDKVWNEFLEKSYVKKEVVTDLENTITDLKKTIKEKDIIFFNCQDLIKQKNTTIEYFEKKVNSIINENLALNRYIENRFDKDVWQDLKQFSHEREVFEADKTAFTTYAEKERLYLNAFSSELEEKLKAIETREKNMVDKEEKMQKQKEE